jgi:small subunit ribosomal protein S16
MLAIRMQRTGRKGHAQFRVVVQDTRQTPSSGRVIANLGTYNPHTKEVKIDTAKASLYITNGAQPSERVSVLLKKEGVKLPSWVQLPEKKTSTIKNSEKLRKNQPAEEVVLVEEVVAETPTEAEAEVVAEAIEEVAEIVAEEVAVADEAEVPAEKA